MANSARSGLAPAVHIGSTASNKSSIPPTSPTPTLTESTLCHKAVVKERCRSTASTILMIFFVEYGTTEDTPSPALLPLRGNRPDFTPNLQRPPWSWTEL